MFRHLEFVLDNPICTCDNLNLDWILHQPPAGKSELQIICKGCGVGLRVPPETMKYGFRFNKSQYKHMTPDERPLPDNVIKFRK